jgi:uncharacterized protein (DUF433 family)
MNLTSAYTTSEIESNLTTIPSLGTKGQTFDKEVEHTTAPDYIGRISRGDHFATGEAPPPFMSMLNTEPSDLNEIPFASELSDHELLNLQQILRYREGIPATQHWKEVLVKYPLLISDPLIHEGRPVVQGTRIAVSTILNYLVRGPGKDGLKRDYPILSEEQITQSIAFTLELLQG